MTEPYTNFQVSDDGNTVSFETVSGGHLYEVTVIPNDSPLNNATAHRNGDTLIVVGSDGALDVVPLPPEVAQTLLSSWRQD